jgi:hypothetical protein
MCQRTAPAGAPRGQKRVGCVHAGHGVAARRSGGDVVVSSGVSLRDVTWRRCGAGDIVKRLEGAREV